MFHKMSAPLLIAHSKNTNASCHTVEIFYTNMKEPPWLANVAPFVVKILDFQGYRQWEMSILFCDDSYIRVLNSTYRQKDYATDVLSFTQIGSSDDLPAGPFYAGDIVISLDSLAENARYFEVDMEEELKRLLIHGILHLAGWNHSDNNPEQPMLKTQEHILSTFLEENISQ